MFKKMNFFIAILFCLSFTLLFTNTAAFSQDVDEDEITIVGEVLATQYDDDDNVLEVAICVTFAPEDTTEEESVEYYWIVNDEIGQELLNLVGKTVEATGVVKLDEDDDIIFTVRKYEIIEE